MPKSDINCPIKPLHDLVIVVPDKAADRYGDLYLPATAQRTAGALLGTVVAVGPGKLSDDCTRRVACSVEVGQRVWFGQYAGNELVIGDEKYVALRDSELLGVKA